MARHKLKFEDYEELALDIRTAEQLVNWVKMLHGGAKFKANTHVFYGFGNYSLDIRKHKDYVYSSFKKHEEKGKL